MMCMDAISSAKIVGSCMKRSCWLNDKPGRRTQSLVQNFRTKEFEIAANEERRCEPSEHCRARCMGAAQSCQPSERGLKRCWGRRLTVACLAAIMIVIGN